MEPTAHYGCHVVESGRVMKADRELLVEEPLLILAGERKLATLMRTPGQEIELTIGFLFTEGLIRSTSDLGAVSFCNGREGPANVVRVTPAAGRTLADGGEHREIFSSCSLCGKETIDTLARELAVFDKEPARLSAPAITGLAEEIRARQPWFRSTGASHAAALALLPLDARSLGEMIVREDVGRHNALDKAVGAALGRGMDLKRAVLLMSGRLSLEMVIKAARAGIRHVAGVSAPTAAAVELARRLNMFLAGFTRGASFTVYSCAAALVEAERQ